MASDRGQRKSSKDKWKDKTWFSVVAPSYLGGKELILSFSSKPETMVGRKIEIPVSEFTGNFRRSNSKVVFRVNECQGMKCSTMFVGHYVSDDYIRRMVRRRKERIDVIKDLESKDRYVITVKLVAVTDGKLTGSKKALIRKTIDQFIADRTKEMDYAELTKYLIGEEVYADVVESVKDIYPLKKVEVRKSELVKAGEMAEEFGEAPEESSPEQVS